MLINRLMVIRLLWDAHVRIVDYALGDRWRDYTLFAGQIAFLIALVPTVVGDSKPEFSTCLITATGMTVFTYVYATVNWWWTTAIASLVTLLWWTLVVQTI